MEDCLGATEKAYREQTEGINQTGFAWKKAAAKVQVMTQNLGDGLSPALLEVLDNLDPTIDKVNALSEAFANADPDTQKAITSLLAYVAGIGPAVMLTGMLIKNWKAIPPVGRLLFGYAMLAAAIKTYWEYSVKYRNFLRRLWNESILGNINEDLKRFNWLAEGINKLLGTNIPTAELLKGIPLEVTTEPWFAQKTGLYGGPWLPGKSPGAMALATAGGAGRGGVTTIDRKFEFSTEVNMALPPGFTPEQKEEILEAAEEVFGEKFERTLRRVTSNNREIE